MPACRGPAESRPGSGVLGIQTKLHRWPGEDEGRRFDDLYNLVCDPAFLTVAGERVRANRGPGRTARPPARSSSDAAG